MAQVDRFRQAEQDLLAIAEYIARDNPTAATRWLDQIGEKLLFLAEQPLIGEEVNQIRIGLHRFTHGKYFIFFYEPRETGIVVVRVLHGARKIEELF